MLQRKRSGVELGEEPSIPVLNRFIVETIEYFEKHTLHHNPSNKPSPDCLDEVLWDLLNP